MAKARLFRERDDGNFDFVEIDFNNNEAETILQVMTPEEKNNYGRMPDSEVAEVNRSYRDDLLMQTDWWCLSDRTPTQAQLDYRQALRDITSHANWPNINESDWPTKPE